MVYIEITTRKYERETYTYYLQIPSVKGEVGILGIEINPRIMVATPPNWCGYTDTFVYDEILKKGHFIDRYHPNWIKEKIIKTCEKIYDKAIAEYDNDKWYKQNGRINYNKLDTEHINYVFDF